jgi:hypothetical protein
MPKAARARIASPPAGTALAHAIRGLPPGPRPTGRGSILHVTSAVTNVNRKETPVFVMTGLVPAIHAFSHPRPKDVDARHKVYTWARLGRDPSAGHDG